ncbi:hypothetical protein [Cellulomonas fimi]|uniref:PKD domain-containing protein n=1 Tax=Cellulomonas fimi TaxID=1708 RepID=A0A7Y0QHE2_CELFI|nr:hypothetical protein [Cellulomonas fimi]NMR20190.1 hypothetical protein [Cellulomonas fimi]
MAQLCADFRDAGGVEAPCPDGGTRTDPVLRRTVDPASATGFTPWNLVDVGGCTTPVDLGPAVAAEFQRLPLTPSTLSVQPPNGWTLVNIDTLAYTDDATQTLTATVLGTPVLIRATPARFAWDFGDGTDPLVGTDPGRPYPDATIGHTYRTAGTRQITLTTTWTADYQVTGTQVTGTGGWTPVTGTATTTTTSPPLTVHTARARLVADPVPN